MFLGVERTATLRPRKINQINTQASGAGDYLRRRLAVHRTLVAVALLAAAVLTLVGCGSGQAQVGLGPLPTYLPSDAEVPDAILTGSAARPALTTEGDTVAIHLADATVSVTVIGPEVPGEGLPYQADATTCTWTVTLTGATAPVAIAATDFNSIDHLGAIYHPTFVAGQPAPPAALMPGQTATFELRAVMAVGEGLMRWAPGGNQIVASWDFEVEND